MTSTTFEQDEVITPLPLPPESTSGRFRLPFLPADRAGWLNMLRTNGLIIFFALLIIVFSMIRPAFATTANLRNVLLSAAVMGILALGQTLVVLTGGVDLSVARTAATAGLIVLLAAPLGPVGATLVVLAATALIGFINGMLITKGKVAPFVVTLGMFTILGSVALLLNNGASINDQTTWLRPFTSFSILSLPGSIWWFIGGQVQWSGVTEL